MKLDYNTRKHFHHESYLLFLMNLQKETAGIFAKVHF